MLFIFSTPVLIRHLLELKTVVFLHWCLIRAVLLQMLNLAINTLAYFVQASGDKEKKVL